MNAEIIPADINSNTRDMRSTKGQCPKAKAVLMKLHCNIYNHADIASQYTIVKLITLMFQDCVRKLYVCTSYPCRAATRAL